MGRLHHMGITVSDTDEAIKFFTAITPMQITGPLVKRGPAVDAVTGQHGAEIWITFLAFDGGSTVLELAEYRGSNAAGVNPENHRPGAAHPAIIVADIETTIADLERLGYRATAAPQVATAGPMEGMRYAYVIGPDELRVELLELPSAG